jgi:8-oxo-dGTP diphosphatase
MQNILSFGAPLPGVEYVSRPGAYALFFNARSELGLVRTDGGRYFLAGGGIETGEDREAALLREVREETGLLAKIDRPLGTAVEYYLDHQEGVYYKKTGYFYLVAILGEAPDGKAEEDHHLIWLPPAEAGPLFYHEMYRWALGLASWGYE